MFMGVPDSPLLQKSSPYYHVCVVFCTDDRCVTGHIGVSSLGLPHLPLGQLRTICRCGSRRGERPLPFGMP
jgi:hypothetical protein